MANRTAFQSRLLRNGTPDIMGHPEISGEDGLIASEFPVHVKILSLLDVGRLI